MPFRTIVGKATLIVAIAGIGWGGLEALKHNRAEKEIVVLQQANVTLTNRVSQLVLAAEASEAAALAAEAGKAQALKEKEAANAALSKALRENPGWARVPIPDSVRDSINR